MDWSSKCKQIKAVVFDIDGTITDGRIGYGCGSDDMIKFFSAKDGLAFRMCRQFGIKTAALTARGDKANTKRLTSLHCDLIKDRCTTKGEGLLEIASFFDIQPENCMMVGDDFFDLPAFAICGISVAVADAAPEVRDLADWVTVAKGGHGALREAVERLLKSRDEWKDFIKPYYDLFKK
jgi:3-deoxy-D-manno-octulosonate 8-phosphate phosphatase (KDO 8-P phosphatase)